MISRLEQLEVKEFTIEEEYFTPDADLTKIALKFKSKKIIDINETGNFVIIKLTLTSVFFQGSKEGALSRPPQTRYSPKLFLRA